MRPTHFLSLLVLVAGLLPRAGARGTPSGGAPATPAGAWEAVIDSPRRPWICLVQLDPAEAGWMGRLRVEGLGELPLENVTVDCNWLR